MSFQTPKQKRPKPVNVYSVALPRARIASPPPVSLSPGWPTTPWRRIEHSSQIWCSRTLEKHPKYHWKVSGYVSHILLPQWSYWGPSSWPWQWHIQSQTPWKSQSLQPRMLPLKMCQIWNKCWDKDKYITVVRHDQDLLVLHSCSMNCIWLDHFWTVHKGITSSMKENLQD